MSMKSSELIAQLRHFDQQHDCWVYAHHELALMFPKELNAYVSLGAFDQ